MHQNMTGLLPVRVGKSSRQMRFWARMEKWIPAVLSHATQEHHDLARYRLAEGSLLLFVLADVARKATSQRADMQLDGAA